MTETRDSPSVGAAMTRRIRSYSPGLAESGMLNEGPRPKAKKSFTLSRPISSATVPSTMRKVLERPSTTKKFSQAAMNA